jgi:hypothetical protein
VGPRCHRDDEESGAVPNIFEDLRFAVELLHGGTCGSAAPELFFQSWSSPKHALKQHITVRPLISNEHY